MFFQTILMVWQTVFRGWKTIIKFWKTILKFWKTVLKFWQTVLKFWQTIFFQITPGFQPSSYEFYNILKNIFYIFLPEEMVSINR